MIKAYDIVPPMLAKELLRLARIERSWLEIKHLPDEHYAAAIKDAVGLTWIRKLWKTGADAFGMQASSTWLFDGPKSFRPTVEQCAALEQIEVRLELHEYAQPYPALLIELPQNYYAPFESVLCYRSDDGQMVSLCSHTSTRADDIVTTIRTDGRPMEISLQRYDLNIDDDLSRVCGRVLRVAVNACLALTNYGCQVEALRGSEVDRDRKWAKEQSERGERARERLATAVRVVGFTQEVKLHTDEGGRGPSEYTGREVTPHWRRGHWRMQRHGPHNSLIKRVLIKPVLVRADLFVGETSDTVAEYRS